MKCPICNVDHFMLCHSCPHANELKGLDYKDSPCRFCDKDYRGDQRENDSREIGHSRVVSLQKVELWVGENLAPESDDEGMGEAAELLKDFIKRLCSLDIRVQFMLEQREFFGKSLEEVAEAHFEKFGKTITPAGVAAALKSAKARLRLNKS